MAALGRAAIGDDILVEMHGRRFGIVGDGQPGDPSLLILDNKAHMSNRQAAPIFGAVVAGSNGVGPVTVANAVKGDTVIWVHNMTTPADASASFEGTVSVTGQVLQTSASNLSGSTYQFNLYARS